MVNYRHRHHTGSTHDLVKHLALVTLLRRLNERPAPWCFLDTHAGEGWYELREGETREAEAGLVRLLARASEIRHPLLADFVSLLRAFAGPGDPPGRSPGSPAYAALLARATDRLVLVDSIVRPRLPFPVPMDGTVEVHRRDACEALVGLLPPREARGLVLVDPPYEKRNESALVAEALVRAVRRFPGGRFLVWYPLSRRVVPPRVPRGPGAAESLRLEAVWDPSASVRGTGLLFVRPHESCRTLLPAACRELLALTAHEGRVTVRSEDRAAPETGGSVGVRSR
jgi:23S rRNA (adenine2030-N6)-methyltransferase